MKQKCGTSPVLSYSSIFDQRLCVCLFLNNSIDNLLEDSDRNLFFFFFMFIIDHTKLQTLTKEVRASPGRSNAFPSH